MKWKLDFGFFYHDTLIQKASNLELYLCHLPNIEYSPFYQQASQAVLLCKDNIFDKVLAGFRLWFGGESQLFTLQFLNIL